MHPQPGADLVAAGGVGLIACQWAKALGATVIGTVGSPAKADLAKAHGCDHVINYSTENFTQRVREITGAPSGYAGPVGLAVRILADHSVKAISSGATGANEKDAHLLDVVPGRDFFPESYADLRMVTERDPCPRCGGALRFSRGIEVGHVFRLGTKYSEAMNATVLDEHVPFLEGIRIEQQFDTFAGCQLALGVLAVDALLATAEAGHFTLFFELADDVVHG